MKLLKRILSTCIVVVLLFNITMPTYAASKIKLSKTSATIYVGDSFTLKISGTSKSASWSSSDKSVATVKKGKVTGKKAGTATISAKIGSKKYKCKVKVKYAGSVTYESYDTSRGVVIIATNNTPYNVSLTANCVYYKDSKMLDKSSDFDSCLEKGKSCALRAWTDCSDYSSYKVTLSSTKLGSSVIPNVSNIEIIDSNFGDENLMVEVQNSGKQNEFTRIAVVYYLNGEIIGYDYTYAEVEEPGASDVVKFDLPFDEHYETIYPDDYEIYVNCSHAYRD